MQSAISLHGTQESIKTISCAEGVACNSTSGKQRASCIPIQGIIFLSAASGGSGRRTPYRACMPGSQAQGQTKLKRWTQVLLLVTLGLTRRQEACPPGW